MNCCKQNKQNQEQIQDQPNSQEQHKNCGGKGKHLLMMLLCCLTPLGVALLLNLFGYSGAASYLVLLLCPLLHLFMMRGMFKTTSDTSDEKLPDVTAR